LVIGTALMRMPIYGLRFLLRIFQEAQGSRDFLFSVPLLKPDFKKIISGVEKHLKCFTNKKILSETWRITAMF
jgi:hypothetical protein